MESNLKSNWDALLPLQTFETVTDCSTVTDTAGTELESSHNAPVTEPAVPTQEEDIMDFVITTNELDESEELGKDVSAPEHRPDVMFATFQDMVKKTEESIDALNPAMPLETPINIMPLSDYCCSTCDERFMSKNALDDHSKIHSGTSSTTDNNAAETHTGSNLPGFACHSVMDIEIENHNQNSQGSPSSCNKSREESMVPDQNAVCSGSICEHQPISNIGLVSCDTETPLQSLSDVSHQNRKERNLSETVEQNGSEVSLGADVCQILENHKPVGSIVNGENGTDNNIGSSIQRGADTGVNASGQPDFEANGMVNSTDVNSGLICKICGENCSDFPTLRDHFATNHSSSRLYTCILCDASFVDLMVLQSHLSDIHNAGWCFGCGKEMPMSDFKSHLDICKFSMLPDFFKTFIEKFKLEAKQSSGGLGSVSHLNDESQFKKISKSKKIFRCKLCRKSFESLTKQKMHSAFSHGSDSFQCDICSQQFNKRLTLLRHKKSDHKDVEKSIVPTCKMCNRKFRTQRSLSLHTTLFHQHSKRHQCNVCGKCFRTDCQLQDHAQSHNTMDCTYCGQKFQTSFDLEAHKMIVHCDQRLYICSICDHEFANQQNLEDHMTIHNTGVSSLGDAVFNISHVDVQPTITSLPIVNREIKSEPVDYGYGDQVAEYNNDVELENDTSHSLDLRISGAFSLVDPGVSPGSRPLGTVQQLKLGLQHQSRLPQNSHMQFSCPECGKNHPSKYKLEMHMEKCFKKYWECDICGKKFDRISQLYGHKNSHIESRTCPDCGVTYKYESCHLKVCRAKLMKEDIHEPDENEPENVVLKLFQIARRCGDKLQCPVCNNLYKREDMKDHLRIHVDQNERICPCCAKSFMNFKILNQHLQICQKHAKYLCDCCEASFSYKNLWHAHQLKHLSLTASYVKLPTFECCRSVYQNIAALQFHQKQSHGRKWLKIQCRLCGEHFLGIDTYLAHVKANPTNELYHCPSCPNRFHSAASLGTHIRKHTNEQTECPVCQQSLLTWDLPMHRKTQHGPELWSEDTVIARMVTPRRRSKTAIEPAHQLAQQHSTKPQIDEDIITSMSKKMLTVVLKPVESVTCSLCRETFKTDSFLKDHQEAGCPMKLDGKDEATHGSGKYVGSNSDVGLENSTSAHEESFTEEPIMAGYKSMVVSDVTKFWCEMCKVYFRSVYYFDKHQVIHNNSAEVGDIGEIDISERSQYIERMVSQLCPKQPRAIPQIRKRKGKKKVSKKNKAKAYNFALHKDSDVNPVDPAINMKKTLKETTFTNISSDKDTATVQVKDDTGTRERKTVEVPHGKSSTLSPPKNQTCGEKLNAGSSSEETKTTFFKSGYKPMTVNEVTKFWCDRCEVYFRNWHYFTKHLIIHKNDIDIGKSSDIFERCQTIERLVWELNHSKRKKSLRQDSSSSDPGEDGNGGKEGIKSFMMENKTPVLSQVTVYESGGSKEDPTSDPLHNVHHDKIEADDQISTEQNKPKSDQVSKLPKLSNYPYKPMTVEHATKFWCSRCRVYFKNHYYHNKHWVMHEKNIDFSHIVDETERRKQIEQCLKRLTTKQIVITSRKPSCKSIKMKVKTKYQCCVCHEYYRSAYFLKQHMKKTHQVKQ